MTTTFRRIARKWATTPNTLRYRLEWPRLTEAFKVTGNLGLLVDAGAGSGEFSRRILNMRFCDEVIAIEPFAANYKILKRNLKSFGQRAKCENVKLQSMTLDDESVDSVICNQVLEHIEDHESVIGEFARVIKGGGYAIITVPKPPEPCPQPDHVREGYQEEELKALFEKRGFKAVHWDWFLTECTQKAFEKVAKLPFKGIFWPVWLVRRELEMSKAERQADQPYGLLCVFQKDVE